MLCPVCPPGEKVENFPEIYQESTANQLKKCTAVLSKIHKAQPKSKRDIRQICLDSVVKYMLN